jgi:hypothetical protein
MRWFDGHVDGLLSRWAEGTLSPRQSARLLRHAHACERCGSRYERLVKASRLLERGDLHTPTPIEEAVLADVGLQAALAAAAPVAEPSRWPSLAVMGGGLAALCLAALVLVRPSDVGGEWQPRGVRPASGAVLRVFCAVRQQPLRELEPSQGTCPPGAMLAFAAGARAPLSHVAMAVRGGGLKGSTEGPFALLGRPGAEQPLETTVSLPLAPGAVEVVAAFGNSPRAALEAVRGEVTPGAVVLHLPVRVEVAP